MALTFRPPAGAAEHREPFVRTPVPPSDNPEADLRVEVDSISSALGGIANRMMRRIGCEAEDYRPDPDDLEAIERLATALNTATAIYRHRREMP